LSVTSKKTLLFFHITFNVAVKHFFFTAKEGLKAIHAAVNRLQNNTCLHFVHVAPTDPVHKIYISGVTEKGCFSKVGYVKKDMKNQSYQELNLDEKDCFIKFGAQGRAEHELMHALGLVHEQSRLDRDQYINIYRNNVQTGIHLHINIIDTMK
jgi:hypothetical protein